MTQRNPILVPGFLRVLLLNLSTVGLLLAVDHPSPKASDDLEAADVGISDLEKNQSKQANDERMKWWREARFGCFVHWGVSSQLGNEWRGKAGGGYAEHIQRVLKIPMADYKTDAIDRFNPTKFDADAWIALVKKTGMRYFVITAKHHDGFAMFDSKASDYNIVKQGPWKHDPMKDLKAACDRANIKFGFYYSHAFDWGDEFAPGNDWEWKNPGGDRGLWGGRNWDKEHPDMLKTVREKYVDRKAIPQIQELIRNYHPAILWFDTPSKLPESENNRILSVVRETDPGVVVNGRLARTLGDYTNTGDRAVEFPKLDDDWEAIPTTNESYGWNPKDMNYKTPGFLIRVIAKAVSRGGNILLNIGPTRDGTIDPHDVAILEGIGQWMAIFGDSIHGANASPLPPQSWGAITSKAQALYLHVFDWPAKPLLVGGLKSTPTKASLMTATGLVPLEFRRLNEQDVTIQLPATPVHSADSVVLLEFADKPQGGGARLVSDQSPINQLLAFDAERHRGEKTGKATGLDYRDGKQNNYAVYRWTSPEQWLSWEVRVNQPTRFEVCLNYGKCKGGEYEVRCGDWKVTKTAPAVAGAVPWIAPLQVDKLGSLTLPAGVHQIELRVTKAGNDEVFRPLEMWLKPAPQAAK